MIDVRVGEEQMIDRLGIEVGLLPVEKPQLLQPLEQTGINQESAPG